MGNYGNFVRDWKRLVDLDKSDPGQRVNLALWGLNLTASEARRVLRDKLNRKISRYDTRNIAALASKGKTFKDYTSNDLHWAFVRDRRALEDIRVRRLRVYQFETKFYRQHFSHMLAKKD